MAGRIHLGVGGWTYEPRRGAFYPDDLPEAKELAEMAKQTTGVEVNGTFSSSRKPETLHKWATEALDGVRFALCTDRRVLADAGDSITRFFENGPTQMGDRLGPNL